MILPPNCWDQSRMKVRLLVSIKWACDCSSSSWFPQNKGESNNKLCPPSSLMDTFEHLTGFTGRWANDRTAFWWPEKCPHPLLKKWQPVAWRDHLLGSQFLAIGSTCFSELWATLLDKWLILQIIVLLAWFQPQFVLNINMPSSYSLWRLAGMDLCPRGMSVNADEYKCHMTS